MISYLKLSPIVKGEEITQGKGYWGSSLELQPTHSSIIIAEEGHGCGNMSEGRPPVASPGLRALMFTLYQ